MKLFSRKKSKQKYSAPPRPDIRKTLEVNGKEYYLSIYEIECAPLNLTLTLDDIATGKPVRVLTKDLGDYRVDKPDEYVGFLYTYLDIKNNNDLDSFLRSRNLCIYSGNEDFVQGQEPSEKSGYPLVKMNAAELLKYDYDGVMRYKKNYENERARLYEKYDRYKEASKMGVCYGGHEEDDYTRRSFNK